LLTVFLVLFGSANAQGSYTVQFGASPTKEEAEEKLKQLQAKNVSAYLVKSEVAGKGTFFRVRAGVFSNQSDAKKYGALLQQRGLITEFFVTNYEKPNVEMVVNPGLKSQPAKSPIPPVSTSQAPPGSTSQVKESPKATQLALNNSPSVASRSITNSPVNPGANTATNPNANSGANPANSPGLKASVEPPPAAGFARFRDSKVGYSFEYPEHWTGQPLSEKEATEQRMNAGAMFVSQKDAAFIQAVWNELEKANNPSSENDLIVDVILKSMSSGEGMKLEETARRMENKNGLIKTFLDLKALYQAQGQPTPIDFLGKAVIIRTARGILLVVAFYSKDAPANAAGAADRVIASVRPPE